MQYMCVIMYSLLVVNTHKKDKKPDVHQVVIEQDGKVSYPVVSLHPNKDHYLQVMTTLSC